MINLLIIIVVLLVLYWIVNTYQANLEGFQSGWDLNWVGNLSKDCYKLNKRDCMKYANCGLCMENGQSKCVPGDVQGPYYKETCDQWVHTDYYDRHIFGEKVTTISPPWSKFYPDYETWWPSPVSRSALQ